MTREFIDFVNAHKDEDTARLLLSAARYPAIDMGAAVQQIEGMRTAKEKWPGLLQCADFLYPPRLNREQASSEETAVHKASLCLSGTDERHSVFHIADLTGGMGIDTFALSGWGAERQVHVEVDYVEQDRGLCELAKHNAAALGLYNIRFHCCDSLTWLQQQGGRHFDLLFVDPARRDRQGRKMADFEDCTPDIVAHQALLFSKSTEVMVKASPMIDITLGATQLRNVSDIYVIAVQGECKEVLFHCRPTDSEPRIHCHHLYHGDVDDFVFTRKDEAQAQANYTDKVKKYLYEPNAALMKAGPFKLLSQCEGLAKLAQNTHLYTSDRLLQHFPGRTFRVLVETGLNRKEVMKWIPEGKAHVVTRNYPVAAAELQKQLGLQEGGDLFIVATTVGREKKMFLCDLADYFLQGK